MNLVDNVGFNVIFDNITGKLAFPDIAEQIEPATRKLSEAKDCYIDGSCQSDKTLYWMYRGICLPADKEKLEAANLRFDITVLAPGKVGNEFVKTIGHYHCRAEGQEEDYPEIYEVVYGKATFYLQNESYTDAVAVEAVAGTKVLIPPGYGHITINTTSDYLVISNIVSSKCMSVYGAISEHKGGAWLLISDDFGVHWKENENYKKHPTLRMIESGDMPVLFGLSGPLYTNMVADPKRFRCMNFPGTCATF